VQSFIIRNIFYEARRRVWGGDESIDARRYVGLYIACNRKAQSCFSYEKRPAAYNTISIV